MGRQPKQKPNKSNKPTRSNKANNSSKIRFNAIYSPSNALITKHNCPTYMDSCNLAFPDNFAKYAFDQEDPNSRVSLEDQMHGLSTMFEDEPGWLCFMCGDMRKQRTLSMHLLNRYLSPNFGYQAENVEWAYITNGHVKVSPTIKKSTLTVIDGITLHDDLVDVRSCRAAYEYFSRHRGKKSIVLLFNNIRPTRVRKLFNEPANFTLYLP